MTVDAPPLDAVIAGPYALEVSSPGLERPLRTPAHFARAVGDTISGLAKREFVLKRAGKDLDTSVTVGRRPKPQPRGERGD